MYIYIIIHVYIYIYIAYHICIQIRYVLDVKGTVVSAMAVATSLPKLPQFQGVAFVVIIHDIQTPGICQPSTFEISNPEPL